VCRVAIDVNLLVEELLAEARLAAGRGEGVASLFGAARVEAKEESRSATACGSRITG
jgi:hypothetical protein